MGWEQNSVPRGSGMADLIKQAAIQADHTLLAGAYWAGQESWAGSPGLCLDWLDSVSTGCQGLILVHLTPGDNSLVKLSRLQLQGAGCWSLACLIQDRLRDYSRLVESLVVRPRAPGGRTEGYEIILPSLWKSGEIGSSYSMPHLCQTRAVGSRTPTQNVIIER